MKNLSTRTENMTPSLTVAIDTLAKKNEGRRERRR